MSVAEEERATGRRDALAWMLCCLDRDAQGARAILGNASPVQLAGALAQFLVDHLEGQDVDPREWIAGMQADDRAALAAAGGA